MKLLSYLAFLACLEGLVFAALVLWLNPRALLNRLGVAIGLLEAWWNACLVVVYGTGDMATALVFDRLSYVAILGLNPLLAWFFLTLAEAPKRLIAALVVPVTVLAAVVAAAYLVDGFPRVAYVPGPWGNVGVDTPRVWSTVSDVASIALDLVYFSFLLRKRQTTTSWRLKQLITVALAGILSAIAAYLILGWITETFRVPGLLFLPAALLTVVHFYVIAQYRFLQKDTPRLDRGWAETLDRPAVLLDKLGHIIGTNSKARALAAPLLEGFPEAWLRGRPLPCDVVTPHGSVQLSPHFDRFGDFVGAAALLQAPLPEGDLSPRETEVLGLVAEGAGNQEIADKLFLSPGTVKRHVHSILAKTGARSRQELVLRYGKPAS